MSKPYLLFIAFLSLFLMGMICTASVCACFSKHATNLPASPPAPLLSTPQPSTFQSSTFYIRSDGVPLTNVTVCQTRPTLAAARINLVLGIIPFAPCRRAAQRALPGEIP